MNGKMTALEAKRLLMEANPAWKAFWFHNGPVARSLKQLSETLPKVKADVFNHHVNAIKNDLAAWVRDVIGDKQLAGDMAKAKTQTAAADLVANRVAELEKNLAAEPRKKAAAKKK